MVALPPSKAHSSAGLRWWSRMITDDLIWEILIRVPVKSLMRFKCVSKLWKSIIDNPKFAIAHSCGGCFRGILIIDSCYDMYIHAHKFLYVKLNDACRGLMQHHLTIQEPQYAHVTTVVKGLVGLFNHVVNEFTLCNVATREFVKLPPSPNVGPEFEDSFDHVYYYFLGFDPVTDVFKVLNSCYCYDGEDYGKDDIELTHIFTLGVNASDTNWRKIDHMPPDLYLKSQQCLCIDGALYWLPSEGEYQKTLTAFHLNNETFKTISIPECTKGAADLVEIYGRPALVVVDPFTEYVESVDVWTMDKNCGGAESEVWTKTKVSLRTQLNIDGTLNYGGTCPTGETMLVGSELDNLPIAIYIYDHLKNELKSISIDGDGFQRNGLKREEMKACYYEENIISLPLLMSNPETSNNQH